MSRMPKFMEDRVVESGTFKGIEWITVQAPIYGALNGYARLPDCDHPWNDIYRAQEEISVHGGVTYGPDENGWVGFDTLHAGDYWPGMDKPMAPGLGSFHMCDRSPRKCDCRRWTPAMVAQEARALAKQVAVAARSMT